MKKLKPRGKTPSLIGSSNGKPQRINVKKKSKCCRCNCDIQVGHDCFGIPKIGQGFSKIKRYCKVCFQNVIEQSRGDLEEAERL